MDFKRYSVMLAAVSLAMVPSIAKADQASRSQTQDGKDMAPMYLPGEKVKDGQLPAGYNQSASYEIKDQWTVYGTADYLYWTYSLNALNIPTIAGIKVSAEDNLGNELEFNPQTPGYSSGFQVGMGCTFKGMDDWNLYSEYTWFQGSNDHHGSGSISVGDLMDASGSVCGSENFHFNGLDLLLKRVSYSGKKLVAEYKFGLKAIWTSLTADFDAEAYVDLLDDSASLDGSVYGNLDASSWSLGPKFGYDTSWLIGCGFKFLTSINGSVLYSKDNVHLSGAIDQLSVRSDLIGRLPFDRSGKVHVSNSGHLQGVAEARLALGWGSYFGDQNYHLDVAVGYDFNAYVSSFGSYSLQGMNIRFRLDF